MGFDGGEEDDADGQDAHSEDHAHQRVGNHAAGDGGMDDNVRITDANDRPGLGEGDGQATELVLQLADDGCVLHVVVVGVDDELGEEPGRIV